MLQIQRWINVENWSFNIRTKIQPRTKSTNLFIYQSTNQANNQLGNQPTNQPVNQLTNQPQPAYHPINKTTIKQTDQPDAYPLYPTHSKQLRSN